MAYQAAFEYRDPDYDLFRVELAPHHPDGPRIILHAEFAHDLGMDTAEVAVPLDRVEEIIAGIRNTARQAAGQPAAEAPVVAYLDDFPRVTLYCREHGEGRPKLVPRTADDLPFGGICTTCGRDVLILAGQPDPTTADDPTLLRWGLGDVLHGDDDTVTICLSGPDREPYWLELDPDRAAALRRDLATPAAEEPVCICSHSAQQHFEDACLICDCGDYLEPAGAREVIARWRAAALKARTTAAAGPAAPTNHDTEPPLTDAERKFLAWALGCAAAVMFSEDGFTDEDDASLARLRRLAAGAES